MKIQAAFAALGLLACAGWSPAQSVTVTKCLVGPGAGQVRAGGSATNGGGYTFRNITLQVGKYSGIPQKWASAVPDFPGARGVTPVTNTFSNLTSGTNYTLRVVSTFDWTGSGPPPNNAYTVEREALQNFQAP